MLYVGFRCFDRSPELVKARAIFRDEQGSADDLVSVMIDAYHGHRGAIQFVSNANGLIEELLQTGETQDTRNRISTSSGNPKDGSRTPASKSR